jgi:hypothetical protein
MENTHENREKKEVIGVITSKTKSDKSTGPKGAFFLNDDPQKYACWSETLFQKFDKGDEVLIGYVVVPNTYQGKTYHNNNISYMKFKNEGTVTFSRSEKEELERLGINTSKLESPPLIIKTDNGKIKLGGVTYRIKEVELELLQG